LYEHQIYETRKGLEGKEGKTYHFSEGIFNNIYWSKSKRAIKIIFLPDVSCLIFKNIIKKKKLKENSLLGKIFRAYFSF